MMQTIKNSLQLCGDAAHYYRHGDPLFWAYISPEHSRPSVCNNTPWARYRREQLQRQFDAGKLILSEDYDEDWEYESSDEVDDA